MLEELRSKLRLNLSHVTNSPKKPTNTLSNFEKFDFSDTYLRIVNRAQKILGEEKIQSLKVVEKDNLHLWKLRTASVEYVYHTLRNCSPEQLTLVYRVYQMASNLNIGPRLRGTESDARALILHSTNGKSHCPSQMNRAMYFACMRALKVLHEALRPLALNKAKDSVPLHPSLSLLENDEPIFTGDIPRSLFTCIRKARSLYLEVKPWLDANVTVIHGNFWRKNALIGCEDDTFVQLVDFEDCGLGHPYYDIAQFSLRLTPDQRDELLGYYLERLEISEIERGHLEFNRILFLVNEATRSFRLAMTAFPNSQDLLSTAAMEKLIRSAETPLFEFADDENSARTLQERGTFALTEVIRIYGLRSRERTRSEIVEPRLLVDIAKETD